MSDILSKYQEAVHWLELTADESQRSTLSDVTTLLQGCDVSLLVTQQLITMETNPTRLGALAELIVTLNHHKTILTNKLYQSSRESSRTLSEVEGDDNAQKRRCHQAIINSIHTSTGLTFSDVAGLDTAKQILHEAVILPLQYPHLFTGSRKPWRRILLYGPPGTGKTRLAQAISGEVGTTFYSVSSSDLISSWVGESEKIVRVLFEHAQQNEYAPVIFIDEIDSICRSRSSQEEDHTRRVKTELLRQMEGANTPTNEQRWFLLCATNCPWELDPAFIRRFQRRIYVQLPCRRARLALFRLHTKGTAVSLSEQDWDTVVSHTEGYSGSDITNVTNDALMEPVRELEKTLYWKQVSDDGLQYYTPCKPNDQQAIHSHLNNFHPSQIIPRSVSIQDFMQAVTRTRSTVTDEMLQRYQEFTQCMGEL